MLSQIVSRGDVAGLLAGLFLLLPFGGFATAAEISPTPFLETSLDGASALNTGSVSGGTLGGAAPAPSNIFQMGAPAAPINLGGSAQTPKPMAGSKPATPAATPENKTGGTPAEEAQTPAEQKTDNKSAAKTPEQKNEYCEAKKDDKKKQLCYFLLDHAQKQIIVRGEKGVLHAAGQADFADAKTFLGTTIDWLIALVGTASLAFIVVGGFILVVSAGEESRVSRAKDMIIYAVIGLIIALVAYVVVAAVQGLLYRTEGGGLFG